MRDAVQLSADLYFPVNAGDKLATILIRTPYNKKPYRQVSSRAQFFAGQGYVVTFGVSAAAQMPVGTLTVSDDLGAHCGLGDRAATPRDRERICVSQHRR